ncbi:hypothetical protein LCL61_38610 [Amycolatopsis coloradensis]|uniref:Uncharacterized protein n=1 Tax=Amycolatopsis coloradensis TaxID=76021 RepID=A0ACD5BQG0_9PSEU
MIPMGRFTRKMLDRPNAPTISPPSVGPIPAEVATMADHSPSIRVRCRRSGNARTSRDRELGMNNAAPMPWASLAAISHSAFGESAQTSEAAKNTAIPAW